MKRITRPQIGILFAALLIIGIGLALNPAAWQFKKLSPTEYTQFLSALFFVALVMERALEVYVRTLYAPETERIQQALDKHQAAIDFKDKERKQAVDKAEVEIARHTELLERCLTSPGMSPESTAEAATIVTWCRNKIQEAKDNRDKRIHLLDDQAKKSLEDHDHAQGLLVNQKILTRLAVFKWSTVFGLAIAALGLRTLTPIIEPAILTPMPELEAKLLTVADITLTGGLLAGGSEGIHKIMQAITSFLDATTAGNKDRAKN